RAAGARDRRQGQGRRQGRPREGREGREGRGRQAGRQARQARRRGRVRRIGPGLMNALRAAAAGFVLLVCGCTAPVTGPNIDINPIKWNLDPWQASSGPVSAYTRSRVADLIDVVPVSVGWGWGFAASVRATPLFHVGLGLTPVTDDRWGFDDRI